MLQGFTVADLGATLTSSNPIIGSTGEQGGGNELSIRLDPWTVVPGSGLLVLHFPEYYEGAGADYYILGDEPTPCDLTVNVDGVDSAGVIDSCDFNRRQNQVEIVFSLPDERAITYGDYATFVISRFKNPLTDSSDGFGVEVFDAEEYHIADTGLVLGVEGVSEPATFAQYAFIYADFANNGMVAEHTFTLTSSMPVTRGCLVRLVYPEEFTIDGQLVSVTGTGFLEAEGATHNFISEPYEERTITFNACEKNYG